MINYNLDLLNQLIIRDKAILEDYDKPLTRDSKINYICNCGDNYTKNFRVIFKNSGCYCKKCTNIKQKEKTKIKFNTEEKNNKLLKESLLRDNATLKGEYVNLSLNSLVVFICKCKTEQKKRLYNIINHGGAYCSKCYKVYKKEKTNKTVKEKYGVDFISQISEVKNNRKITCLKKYGFENPSQNKDIQNKIIKTNLEKYGVKYTCLDKNIREKQISTLIKNYNVKFPSQSQLIQEKISKNSLKFKKYKMPSGNIRNVQGYEPFALDELVKIYNEEEIITDRKLIPRIEYEINNIKKYYFPDIYIPKDNLIIEVKSPWTYYKDKDINMLKFQACIKNNYKFEFWIYNKKKEKQIVVPPL